MATVYSDRDCREGFGENDDDGRDPDDRLALAGAARGRIGGGPFDAPGEPRRQPGQSATYHRIAAVRQRQGVTLRNVARRLGMSLPLVRRQEQPDCDLRISDLHRWQEVLDVPVAELLEEGEGQLSGPVLERSRMVKLMKTAAALRDRTAGQPLERMVGMLVEQILEIMPELRDVTPWHTVGQRRTLDDVGRTARTVVPEEVFRRSP